MADDARPAEAGPAATPPQALQALQFEQAEFTTPTALRCQHCSQTIAQVYYTVAGQVCCEPCWAQLRGVVPTGSGLKRFGCALVCGVLAAAAGSGLYFAITALTGYELGLVAIVVGFLVGNAVRWGAQGRGGWLYQGLAIVLTYSAIVTTYIPPLFHELRKVASLSQTTPGVPMPDAARASTLRPETLTPQRYGFYRFVTLAVSLLLLYVLACAAPFLGGWQNIMGLVIIGIGLYEAWKLNKRVTVPMAGPYTITTALPETPATQG